jgi:hypothetical protein
MLLSGFVCLGKHRIYQQRRLQAARLRHRESMLNGTLDSLQSQFRTVHEFSSRFRSSSPFGNLGAPPPVSTSDCSGVSTTAPATPPMPTPLTVSDPTPSVVPPNPSTVCSTPPQLHRRHQEYPSPPTSTVHYGTWHDNLLPSLAPMSATRLDVHSPTRRTWTAPGLSTPSPHAYDLQSVYMQQHAMCWSSPPLRPLLPLEAHPPHPPRASQPPQVELPLVPRHSFSGTGFGSSSAGAPSSVTMRENRRPNSLPTKLQKYEETILRVEQLVREAEAEAATETGGEDGSTELSGRKRKRTDDG